MAENKSTKRIQVDKDKTRIFVIISVAAVVTVASLVIAKGFWSQGNYTRKVANMKSEAVDQLKENKEAVSSLTEAYKTFVEKNPNLLGGTIDGETDRDGDNGTLILDALPNKYNFPAVAASLEKLLDGYNINDITGIDDSAAQAEATPGAPIEIPFAFNVRTNYNDFKKLITSFNRSIRPFQLTHIELSGTNGALQLGIQGKTFYQPETGVQIEEKDVP